MSASLEKGELLFRYRIRSLLAREGPRLRWLRSKCQQARERWRWVLRNEHAGFRRGAGRAFNGLWVVGHSGDDSVLLCLDLSPNHIGLLPDSPFGNQFPRHGGQHVFTVAECLKSFFGKFPLHGQRDQQLFPHEA